MKITAMFKFVGKTAPVVCIMGGILIYVIAMLMTPFIPKMLDTVAILSYILIASGIGLSSLWFFYFMKLRR